MNHFRPHLFALLAALLPAATAHAQSAPAAPTGLAAAPLDAQAALTWNDPSDSTITGYSVRSSTSLPVSGTWTAIASSGATTTSHTVASLTNGTRYYFQIRATNTNGNSAASNAVTIQLAATPSAAVAIPDSNLRTKLEAAAGKAAGETITQLDMAKQEALDLFGSDIANPTGLEYAVNVLALNLSRNSIADVTPIGTLTALRLLDIVDNQVSNIAPLGTLTSLTRLDLRRNAITDVTPLGTLTSLRRLYLSHNQITDVAPLGTLTSLTTLRLADNRISDVAPLGTLTALTDLSLGNGFGGNRISDVTPLGNLTSLTQLWLWGNRVSDVTPLSTLTSLTRLILNDNQISDIAPLGTLAALTQLWVQDNRVSSVTLGGLTSLEVLGLDNNQISEVTLGSLPSSLTALGLVGNRISGFAQLSGLGGLTSLTSLLLARNQIPDVTPLAGLTALAGLERLGLEYNGISDITPLGGLTSLTDLGLSGNPISDLAPLGGLTALAMLGLNNMPISDLTPLANLASLSRLYLYSCRITNVSPLARLTALSDVDLGANQIADVAALARNFGIGSGDSVNLLGNPLSRASVYTHIPAMQRRGVRVYFDSLPSEPNTAPQAIRTVDDAMLAAGGRLTVDLLGVFRDPDGDPLTFSASSSRPAVATVRLDGIMLTVTAVAEGQAQITARAEDNFGATATLSFLVTVGNPVYIGGDGAAGMRVVVASVPEGGVAEIPIAMAAARTVDVSFAYSFGPDGDPATADADAADHGGEGGTVTIPAGETEATISIPILDDDDIEPAREAFAVTLTPTDGVGVAVSSAVVHIAEGVCDRTWQVADALRGGRACEAVTPAELSRRRFVPLQNVGLGELKALDFLGMAGMTVLILDDNGLSALPEGLLAGSPKLRVLRLRGNRFQTLPALGSAPALVELDLTNNLLAELPLKPFADLPALGYLYLGENQIEALPADLLAETETLRILELQDNAITALPEGAFAGVPKLVSLQLQGNPGAPFPLAVELARVEAEGEERDGDTGGAAGDSDGDAGDGQETENESGRAEIQLRVPQGAPFAIEAGISAPGATLSAQTAAIAAGETLGGAVSVIRGVAGNEADTPVTIEITSIPNLPTATCGDDFNEYRCFRGFELTPGSPLTLFESPSTARTPTPRMR